MTRAQNEKIFYMNSKSSDSSDTGLYKLLTGAVKMTESFKSAMLLDTHIKQKEI